MDELNIDNPNYLTPGTVIAGTNRVVIIATLIREATNDSYPVHIAVAHNPDEFHKYVVWYVSWRQDGWHAEAGEYFHDAKDAIINWQQKGGK